MMSSPNVQNESHCPLSVTSLRMLELGELVLAEWEDKVRASLPKADNLQHPILINTLPAFYNNIAQAVTVDFPRQIGSDGTTLAAEHGGERARMTAYDQARLVGEYQIFRAVIFDVLRREEVGLNHQELLTINASIDLGIREAVNGFTLVHAGLRERFAAALTHDLRGPLAVAVSAIEVSLLTNDQSKAVSMAERALKNLRRMDTMISDLLHSMSFAGGHPMQIKPTLFDILEVLTEVQLDTVEAYGARVTVSGSGVMGWWGRGELKRAVENLITNALKYGSSHGPVTVTVSEAHGRLLVAVHNEGAPIPISEQECIFQMYRRAEATKRTESKGWGIGLPYVRAVAESHGGSISLDSTQELGTTFMIDIPVDCRDFENHP